MNIFRQRYGSWAIVAGASEGLGAAFATELARRGLNLVLIARQQDLLENTAQRIREQFQIQTKCMTQDLADSDLAQNVRETIASLDIGMLVYNAAYIPSGMFANQSRSCHEQLVRVNVVGPLELLHEVLPQMTQKRSGGIVFVSSLAGMQGSPGLTGYAATKAFITILGEGLWAELKSDGIDVVTLCAGAISTPNYSRLFKEKVPGMVEPAEIAKASLNALGNGPRLVPGLANQVFHQFARRIMSRSQAINFMKSKMANLK